MSNYKDIVGTAVRNNAGNIPTAETGQVWFDSTNLDFKYLFPATIASWRTTASMNTPRYGHGDQIGSATSGMVYGGYTTGGPPPPVTANAENWNGSSWTEVNNLNSARNGQAGAGLYTAGLAYGGYGPPPTTESALVESWNGSSWPVKPIVMSFTVKDPTELVID